MATKNTKTAKAAKSTVNGKSAVKKVVKKSMPSSVPSGRMYIKASFNSTLVTFTDQGGNVVCWANTGLLGFKGTRKSTPYAATTTIEEAVKKAKDRGMHQVAVYIKGPGPGRDATLRVLRNAGFDITQITDLTPMPHNGCRPKKPRRV